MPKNISKEDVNIGDVIYHWTVKEYDQHIRDKRWYVIAGILGVALVVYAIIAGNYLFALIVVLFAIIMFMQDMIEPVDVDFVMTNTGIVIGQKYYRYSELKNFWIIYNPPMIKNLYFGMNSLIKHRLQIPLLDYDPRPIRQYIAQFVEEDLDQEEEPLSDRLSNLFKI